MAPGRAIISYSDAPVPAGQAHGRRVKSCSQQTRFSRTANSHPVARPARESEYSKPWTTFGYPAAKVTERRACRAVWAVRHPDRRESEGYDLEVVGETLEDLAGAVWDVV